jgi:hypothetical protein
VSFRTSQDKAVEWCERALEALKILGKKEEAEDYSKQLRLLREGAPVLVPVPESVLVAYQ